MRRREIVERDAARVAAVKGEFSELWARNAAGALGPVDFTGEWLQRFYRVQHRASELGMSYGELSGDGVR